MSEPASLGAFFAAAVPYLKGQTDVGRFTAALGESPSGGQRLEFYRRLMRANVHRVIDSLYAEVKTAVCRDHGVDGFAALVDAFDAAHPPASWDKNSLGADFPAFLESEAAADRLPAWLSEVADYAWTRYAIGRALNVDSAALAVPTAVRAYAHDVVGFVPDIGVKGQSPALRPTAVVIYRDGRGVVRVVRARRAMLVALAEACGQLDAATAALVDVRERSEAHAHLVALGVLATDAARAPAST